MPFAVTLRLDRDSSLRVAALWEKLAQRALSDLPGLGYGPHVTLAVLGDGAADLTRTVAQAVAAWQPLSIGFAGFGVFPGPPAVLWLAPVPDAMLLARQSTLCDALPTAWLDRHYKRGAWVPHVTLAEELTAEGLAEAVAIVTADWRPFSGTLVQVDLVRFRPVQVIWSGTLGRPSR